MDSANQKIKDSVTDQESERLEALWQYNIIDTLREKEFDAITKMAARICNTPISLVNLIDNERQWSKSTYGIDLDEMPKDEGICQNTIMEDELLEVENLLEDERFKEKFYVKEDPNLRFYAGVPLKTPKGHNIGALCVMDDEAKHLSKWQKETLRILAEEVIARLELRLRQRQLEELNDQKDEILNIVSHDMRNPLTGIIGISNLVKTNEVHDNEELNYLMDMIESSARHLLNNVNELLDVAYIESGSFELDAAKINIKEAVEDTIALQNPAAKVKGVNIHKDLNFSEAIGWYDEVRLEQVLGNLLTNAIKFTPSGGEVYVKVGYSNGDATSSRNALKIEVRDTGIGIPEKFIPILFTKYGKHSRIGTAGEKSSGLGMPLLKEIVTAHNGSVDVESKEGEGTCFRIVLPEIKDT